MIDDAVGFLKGTLNEALPRDASGAPTEDLFVYAGVGKDDAVSFKSDAVSISLIRIEEDTTLRQADPYSRANAEGVRQRVNPEIRLNLYLLLVAKCPDDYGRALSYLSRVIRYFQNHRVFNRHNSPGLPEHIGNLQLELATPSFSEQNEIWSALRAAYLPSALYKVRLIVFRDDEGETMPSIREVRRDLVQAR